MTGGDDHPNDLFCGDEGPTNPDPSPSETDAFEAGGWLSSVSYREIHSFTLGFAPMFLLLLLSPAFPSVAPPLLGAVVAVTLGGIWTSKVPEGRIRRWLCKEPHYAWGGQALALVLTGPIYLLAGGI